MSVLTRINRSVTREFAKERDRPLRNVLSKEIASRYGGDIVLFRETRSKGALAGTWFSEQKHSENRLALCGALFGCGYAHVGR